MLRPLFFHLFLWLLMVAAAVANGQSLEGIAANKAGVRALEKEEHVKAFRAFSEALAADPGVIEYRLNMAYTYSLNQEFEKAEKEYLLAIEMAKDRPELQFAAYFNLGRLRTEKGDIDGALDAYQKALDLHPTSKEVKTNIELIWQQQEKQGGGQGQKKDKSDQKPSDDSQGGEQDKDQNQDPGTDQNDQPDKGDEKKPQSFENLTPEMARKVLEELKAQEQKVRADHMSQGVKERPRDKQW